MMHPFLGVIYMSFDEEQVSRFRTTLLSLSDVLQGLALASMEDERITEVFYELKELLPLLVLELSQYPTPLSE